MSMGLEKKQPFNREYREVIKEHKDDFKENSPANYTYAIQDSPLRGADDNVVAFEDSFRNVLPEGQRDLRNYIEQALAQRKGEAIGLEFGGPGSKFFAGFSRGFFKKTAGIDAAGRARMDSTFFRGVREMIRGHMVIQGDILVPRTYSAALGTWLGDDKPDLIVEHMVGGFELNPIHPMTVYKTFKRWYELLNKGGIMFVQVPHNARPIVQSWVDMVRGQDFSGLLEVAYHPTDTLDGDYSQDLSVLRLRKLPGAPLELPMLDPQAIRDISTGRE